MTLLSRVTFPALAALAATLLALPAAQAVPSYARQTGSDCAACHVGAFGPQLTPFGIQFKLGGYTDTDGKGANKIPLSGMVVVNHTHTATPLDEFPEHFKDNNNSALQEASVFLAGRLSDNLGAFIQQTYSGVDRKWALDVLDLRYARSLTLGGKDATVGLSLNNNPTLTDPFNTLGQWRFPYTESDFGHGFGSSPLVENLGGGVTGLNAYALWDKNWYGEFGLYGNLSHRSQRLFNTSRDAGDLKSLASYWRLGYMVDRKRENFNVGLLGFNARLLPTDATDTAKFRDIGIDAGYQYLGNREHIYTVNASYVHENQNKLNNLRLAGSYTWQQTYGVTAGLFSAKGQGGDNTAGYLLQADWTPWGKETSWGAPWANVRLGLQFVGYNKFSGAAKASDKNTTTLFAWTAF